MIKKAIVILTLLALSTLYVGCVPRDPAVNKTFVGTITHDGAPLPGVQLLMEYEYSPYLTTTTNSNGKYAFPAVTEEGCYRITPSKPGYQFDSLGFSTCLNSGSKGDFVYDFEAFYDLVGKWEIVFPERQHQPQTAELYIYANTTFDIMAEYHATIYGDYSMSGRQITLSGRSKGQPTERYMLTGTASNDFSFIAGEGVCEHYTCPIGAGDCTLSYTENIDWESRWMSDLE